ncbi:hypothetical protein Gpo141_00001946 [Globisporangium polare]
MNWQKDLPSVDASPSPLASLESVFSGATWDADLLSEVSALLQPHEAGAGERSASLSDDEDEDDEDEDDEMGDDDLAILNQLLATHSDVVTPQQQQQQQLVSIPPQTETSIVPASAGSSRVASQENEQLTSSVSASATVADAMDVEEMQFTGRTTRERRRQELAFLRTKALELEAKLAQHKQRRQQEADAPQSESSSRQSRYAALWMKLAKRQEEERRLAQTENAKLRQLVVAQVRLARSLDRVLRKRMKHKTPV